jgi:opacity protein-like surface antigen
MRMLRRVLARCACLVLILTVSATARAQTTTVRVTRDQTTIWKPGFAIGAAVVRTGTILTVVGRRGNWYEVLIPGAEGRNGATGFIFYSSVELVSGQLPDPGLSQQTSGVQAPSPRSREVGVRGFGQFGYTWFSARDSFEAVLGQPGGALLGGGGEVRFKDGFFVAGSIAHFGKTGERVFVLDREVFRLGIPNTITLTPVTATAGWRFSHERATPYVGAGAGTIAYKESSSFAEAGEDVADRFTSYHVLGGVEFRNDWIATAFEVQYSRVPDALGIGGASAAFGEHDLGGFDFRIKILVGR